MGTPSHRRTRAPRPTGPGLAAALLAFLAAAPLAAQPPDRAPVVRAVSDVVGSNDPQWIRIDGEGIPSDAVVRLRTRGVDAVVVGDDRVHVHSSSRLDVRATVGNEATAWAVEIGGADGPFSAPVLFRVLSPRPTVSHVAVVAPTVDRPSYTLRVFGDGHASYSEIVLDGETLPTRPVASSPYATALTVGLEATLDRDVFQAHRSREVRVFTRGPGGGVSDPFTLAIDPVPLWGRWPFWAGCLAALLLLGAAAHRLRVLRLRRHELAALVEARTAELVAERERTQAQADALADQAEELREARDARSRLFANVSHELRTPLTLVQGPLDDVLRDRHGPVPDGARAALAVARSNVGHLSGLVDRLFRLTLLEAGRVSLDPRPLDLAALVDHVAAALQPLAEREDVTLAALTGVAIPVHADPEALGDAVGNVVRNAIQHSPPGGTVSVSVALSSDADEALVAVVDSGRGVAAPDRERIFERFERGEGDHEGLGLGLALTREVLRAHGGDVTVEPAGRRGARFVLALPALPAGSIAAAAADGSGANLWDPPEPDSPTDVAPWPDDELPEAPLVYLVDDHDGVRAYVAHALQAEFRVDQASCPDQALADLGSRPPEALPDVVVLDVMMPGRDGLDLVSELRNDRRLSDLPVLFLSARAGPDARRVAIEAGGDDYLEKPFDAPELRARLRRLLDRRRAMQARYRDETRIGPLGVVQSEDEQFFEALLAAAIPNLSDPRFRVDALADEVALSKSQLGRRLKKAVGRTPAEFLRTLRLEHAAALLQAGHRVGETANAVGFRDTDHFSAVFAEAYGARPSDYAAAAGTATGNAPPEVGVGDPGGEAATSETGAEPAPAIPAADVASGRTAHPPTADGA